MSTPRSGWDASNAASLATSVSAVTDSSLSVIVWFAWIETVRTSSVFTGCFASPLGSTRSVLFSMSGVVIMKMISSTNARSSSGVTFSSLSVCSAWRSEKRRISC